MALKLSILCVVVFILISCFHLFMINASHSESFEESTIQGSLSQTLNGYYSGRLEQDITLSFSPTENDSFRDIDKLGFALKRKVEMLFMDNRRKLDIVFLIDASASIGDKNFASELKFVKKLLADLSISENETRVAVITFSDEDKVIRHIDHISVPSAENHKCNMLHNDLPSIKYSGGLTYTLGALIEAQSVLEWSRLEAQKAVFLITDGFSNGGDPVPIAQLLKDNGTLVFTFGIQSGNIDELKSMASFPPEEYSYIVDSFDQFEALVRRALHLDLSTGSYQLLHDSSSCGFLCSDSTQQRRGCCDSNAQCSCGTGSGHYRCLCNPGFYGFGFNGSCHACPIGTYNDGQIPGDESSCVQCPDPNHITRVGQASFETDCFCKQGFIAQRNSCEVVTCPILYPPEHGYFVKGGMCQNVFNAACGMRCKSGYTLHGSSIRLCQENGTWSGKAPSCVVKMCPDPVAPTNGNVKCFHEPSISNDLLNTTDNFTTHVHHYTVDTECQFSCNPGHILIGSRRRICLPLARWDGLRTVCKPVTCPPLPKLPHGSIFPELCTDASKVPFGLSCNITCNEGFRLVGPKSRKCGGKGGQWSKKLNSNKCVDEQPPLIECPKSIQVFTDLGEAFSTVTIPQPFVSDNSGMAPLVWSLPPVSSHIKIPIGTLHITFVAMDHSNNQAVCNISVTVVDKEPPTVDVCISPNPVRILGTQGNHSVTWLDPEFHDNSGKKPTLSSSHDHGEFPVGKTEVVISAFDESGNNSTCVIEVIVEGNLCSQDTPKVQHATVICSPVHQNPRKCSVVCNEGYSFDENSHGSRGNYTSSEEGVVMFSCPLNDVDEIELPQCSEAVLPNSISIEGDVSFTVGQDTCSDIALIENVKSTVMQELSQTSDKFCNNYSNIMCNVSNARATCEGIKSLQEEQTNLIKHRKRSLFSTPDSLKVGHIFQLVSTHTSRRETADAMLPRSRINLHFQMTARMTEGNESVAQPPAEGKTFGLFRDALSGNTMVLPPPIKSPTLVWRGNSLALNCTPGSVAHSTDGTCLKCPPGSHLSSTLKKCVLCPLGTYQHLNGQTTCQKCAVGMSTRFEGSRSVHNCLYLCQPGSYGKNRGTNPSYNEASVSPCYLCHPGSYQPNYGATKCIPCPPGQNTNKKGARNLKDCFILSSKNQQSLYPSCLLSNVCQNGGTCRSSSLGFVSCDCQQGFYGSFCDIAMDHCLSSPCFNGGKCVTNQSFEYFCICPPGLRGHSCEEDIDECNPNPCFNNGTCEDLSNGYFCDCPDGFQGAQCEENINDCSQNPCGENGLCVDGVSNYSCTCMNGYMGQHCENEPVHPCLKENPCSNGGLCVILSPSAYRCVCLSGWEGMHCDVEKNSCLSSPCHNKGICVTKRNGQYTCECQPFYTGSTCQTRYESDFVLNLNSVGVTDYAIVDFPPKDVTEVTACLWLQSKDGLNYGTAFSYANKNHFNSLTLTDYNGFVLYVNGDRIVTDVTANDGMWHHVCVTWQSDSGLWSIYLDGVLIDHGLSLSANSSIQGGGKWVLGQEQDSVGGSFSEAESFIGRIYRFDVWDSILDQSNITQLAKQCQKNIDGDLLKWQDFLAGISGKIQIEKSQFCSDCPALEPLWHGTVTVTESERGTVASYICDDGFVMHRSKLKMVQRHCLKQASWEGETPICVRQSCGFPGYLPGGTFVGRFFQYTDTVIYKCHHGAEIIGNATRVCQADGKWSGEPPLCKGQECPTLANPMHGHSVLRKKSNGMQVATFMCDDGFYIDGAQTLTCMHDGSWDEAIPDCLHITCPNPPLIPHASSKNRTDGVFVFDDIIYYDCEQEYELSPMSSKSMKCGKDGSWCPYPSATLDGAIASIPTCAPKRSCLRPDDLRYGRWVLQIGAVDENLHFSETSVMEAKCESFRNLHGPKTIHCQNGIWLPSDPTQCVMATCDTEELPFDVPHSSLHLSGEEVGDTANLTCRHGYQLHTAKSSSSYSVDDLSAEPVLHGFLTWMCNPNASWVLSNEAKVVSDWLACLPKAETENVASNIQCIAPKVPNFGFVVTTVSKQEFPLGSIIVVQCRSGFWLEGSSSLVCGENGDWIGLPVCKPVTCKSPSVPQNMVVSSSTVVRKDIEFGNLLTYSCKSGFQPHGDLSIRCQSDGEWSKLKGKCMAL